VHVLAAAIELHIPESHSLKDKRSVLRPILDGLRNRHPVAVAETAHQDTWQRAEIGVVAISSSATQVAQILDEAERFVWSFPEVEVLGTSRSWMEED
jgi:uncharacterized protein YlxP (DUF503 family)